jgi:hypothetical protein
VDGSDIGSLVLASQPILDLSNIDFVQQAMDACPIPGSSSPCMWIGIETAAHRGSTLLNLLGRPVKLEGVPFVMMADEQRICMGTFISSTSSFAIAGPEVMGEEIAEDGFPIYPPNEHIVPGPVAPDLRSDPRILKVLTGRQARALNAGGRRELLPAPQARQLPSRSRTRRASC